MRKNIFGILLLITLITVCVCGCSKKNKVGDITVNPGESAIYIEEDGTVSYAICEAFDQEYYDKDDLKDLIEDEIEEFNVGPYASSTKSADVDSFQVKDDAATAIITFESIQDYVNYVQHCNGQEEDEIFVGKISDALDSDIKISGEFTVVKDGAATEETVKGTAIKELDSNIIVVNEKLIVQLENKEIEYISANCTIADGIVTVTDDETAYIVYK